MDPLFNTLTSLEVWISGHLHLITVIGIPTLSWFLTSMTTRASEKRAAASQALERELHKTMLISEQRERWVNEITEVFLNFLRSIEEVDGDSKRNYEMSNVSVNKFLLLSDPFVEETGEILERMTEVLGQIRNDEDLDISELAVAMNLFLLRERRAIKNTIVDGKVGLVSKSPTIGEYARHLESKDKSTQ